MRLRLVLGATLMAALLVPAVAQAYIVRYGTVGPGTTITLKRPDGTIVRRTRHGLYTLVIRDRSSIHNFHLIGRGVDKRTGVAFTGRRTWSPVRLRIGTYTILCDAHPDTMRRTFTVF